MKPYGILFPLLLLALPAGAESASRWSLALEGGRVFAGRADVRIPGDAGTRFSITDDLRADGAAYARARLAWRPAERHGLALTAAPLEVTATGRLPRETRFAETLFPADRPARARYRFDNYRLTYRYLLTQRPGWTAELGGTLFVRDARITLEAGDRKDSDSDLGLVPLLSFRLAWEPRPALAFVVDGDALIAPQGRAADVLLAVQYEARQDLRVGIGYRILEGGADNDTVYTFAAFHHAAAYLDWRF